MNETETVETEIELTPPREVSAMRRKLDKMTKRLSLDKVTQELRIDTALELKRYLVAFKEMGGEMSRAELQQRVEILGKIARTIEDLNPTRDVVPQMGMTNVFNFGALSKGEVLQMRALTEKAKTVEVENG